MTPNKGFERHSINYRLSERAPGMNQNFLRVAMVMQDNNINFSASRRKSVRAFSNRRSKDNGSDFSQPRPREEIKTVAANRGGTISPDQYSGKLNEQKSQDYDRLSNDKADMPFKYSDKARGEREEALSDRLSNPAEYVVEENVVVEVEEAEEEEK